MSALLPGACLGIFGAGQLGRMSILAGRRLGYRFRTYSPTAHEPAAVVADRAWVAAYDDVPALREFAAGCGAVTFEFENVPGASLAAVADVVPIRPGATILHTSQNRRREKIDLQARGYPLAPFRVVDGPESLARAAAELGRPCVLKTADFGYDGKGQRKLTRADDKWEAVWAEHGQSLGVVEGWVDFVAECSVLVARSPGGEVRCFPLVENRHRDHILHLSLAPVAWEPAIEREAQAMASQLAVDWGLEGLLAVEFFLTRDGRLLINETAPRPHNSGHLTLDACLTNQFEQHVRAICGLPLGEPELLRPGVMLNLLGDLWARGEPDWAWVLARPGAKLHLYGKQEARPGRKMGHVTMVAETLAAAEQLALALDRELRERAGFSPS